ncbi:MAG TPA: SCP2 sterol-binding domain-containing protein [Micromonosporaceae bacterium]
MRSIEEFFERTAASRQPLLHGFGGKTIRVDLEDDGTIGHWFMQINHDSVQVSRRNGRADAVLAGDQALFGRLVAGEANALTAALRGQMRLEGDSRLLVAFDRLMPSPPSRRTTLPPQAGRRSKQAVRAAKAAGTAPRTARASSAAARMTRKDRAR